MIQSGGTTPSLALFREIRRHTNIRTHILIPPRCGDFCYSAYEFAVMEEEIRAFAKAGAGVMAQLIPKLGEQTGICTYHMSGKKALDSAMVYRKESVSMGSAAVDEYCIWRCDAEEVRNARKALNILNQAVR